MTKKNKEIEAMQFDDLDEARIVRILAAYQHSAVLGSVISGALGGLIGSLMTTLVTTLV